MKEHGRSRRTDPYTSHLAGERINVNKLEKEAMGCLASNGPRSSAEIAQLEDRPRDTFSPRMRPLEKKGLVYRHDVKPCRNPSGRVVKMIVWALTAKGRGFLGLAPEPPLPSSSPAGAAAPIRQDEFEFGPASRAYRGDNDR